MEGSIKKGEKASIPLPLHLVIDEYGCSKCTAADLLHDFVFIHSWFHKPVIDLLRLFLYHFPSLTRGVSSSYPAQEEEKKKKKLCFLDWIPMNSWWKCSNSYNLLLLSSSISRLIPQVFSKSENFHWNFPYFHRFPLQTVPKPQDLVKSLECISQLEYPRMFSFFQRKKDGNFTFLTPNFRYCNSRIQMLVFLPCLW